MRTHSSILTWIIPWTEEPGGLQSKGSQRVRNQSKGAHTAHVLEEKEKVKQEGETKAGNRKRSSAGTQKPSLRVTPKDRGRGQRSPKATRGRLTLGISSPWLLSGVSEPETHSLWGQRSSQVTPGPSGHLQEQLPPSGCGPAH